MKRKREHYRLVRSLPRTDAQWRRYWEACVDAYAGISDERDTKYRPLFEALRVADPFYVPVGDLTRDEEGCLVVSRRPGTELPAGMRKPTVGHSQPERAEIPVLDDIAPSDQSGTSRISWQEAVEPLVDWVRSTAQLVEQRRGVLAEWLWQEIDAGAATATPFELFITSLIVLAGPEITGASVVAPSLLPDLIRACASAFEGPRWGFEKLPPHLADRLGDLIRAYYAALRSAEEHEADYAAPSLERDGGRSSPGDPTASYALRRVGRLEASHVAEIGKAIGIMSEDLRRDCKQIYGSTKHESSLETAKRLGLEGGDSNIRRKSMEVRVWVAHHLPPGWERW